MWRATVCTTLLVGALQAQDAANAAAITAPGRKMSAALDSVLGGQGAGEAAARAVLLVLDPSPDLAKARFVDELTRAFARNAARMQKTAVGIASVTDRRVRVEPGADRGAVLAAAKAILAGSREEIRNVYEPTRRFAAAFGQAPGERNLVLVTMQNGDAEDDLRGTVAALGKHDVRFSCITTEAFFADSYWAGRPHQRAPAKTKLTGGDNAFVDLPWGFLLQHNVANEVAPSGFAVYGLSHLAAKTEGRVHLYSGNRAPHSCAVYGGCLFCSNDHAGENDVYWRARLGRIAPSTRSRSEVLARAGADPYFRATLKAWQAAAKAGLVRSTPSVRLAGNGLALERPRGGRAARVLGGLSLGSQRRRTLKAAKDCARILLSLQKQLAAADKTQGTPRSQGIAALTAVMLQLTKVNLVTLAGFYEEIAPKLVAKRPPEFAPPEIDPLDRTRRPAGIGFSTRCLCHGVAPFFGVDLPGGEALKKELAVLQSMVDAFERLHGHTPVAAGLHRSGIAIFHVTYRGIAGKRPRRRPKSRTDQDPLTQRGPARPSRSGGSSAGAGGPTTGR